MGCATSVPTTAADRPGGLIQAQLSGSNNRVSRPVIRTRNYQHGSTITQTELNNSRLEFWQTRTDGNAVMWQAIRTAAEAILDNDLGLANAILEASNISTPGGTLEVSYDERGHQYKVPNYCIANPIELAGVGPALTDNNLPTATTVNDPKKLTKGNSSTKAKVVEAVPIQVKIRINPGDYNLLVQAETTYSILDLKHSIVEQSLQSTAQLPALAEERQRIIFMGRELQNAQIIGELGLDESKVIQVFLRPQK
eukprot:gene15924-21604_t